MAIRGRETVAARSAKVKSSSGMIVDRASTAFPGPGCDVSSSEAHFQLKAEDGLSPLEMTDFSRPVAWLPGANDNTFRSTLELRYAPKTDSVWTINELPIASGT